MKNRSWQILTLMGLVTVGLPLHGQETSVKFGGQVRPRMEGRDPVAGERDVFTSMRVRGALDASLENQVRVFVQFQDVRLFGEETNTLGDYSGDNLDLHQGFLELGSVPHFGGVFRVGRQEMALGEQRLVGAVNWTQQGRSFDGARYTTPSLGSLTIDLFGMKLREETASTQEFDSEFWGAWGNIDLGERGSLEVFGLLTTDSRDEGTEERTLGALWRGTAGPVQLRAEGSLQGGTRGDEDVSAFMVGLRAGINLSDVGTVTLWYDHLSGDEDPDDGESGVFNTLFATNHAFYGFADYFLNIPVHTGGLGLRDTALKFAFFPWEQTRLTVDLHIFQTAQDGSLSTQSLGNEFDVTLSRPISQGLSLGAGYAYFQAKDGMEELGRLEEDAQWFYLMLDAAF